MKIPLRVNKNILYYVIIFLILVFEHQCFYLLPFAGLNIADFCVIFEMAIIIISIITFDGRISVNKYSSLVICGLILVFTSAFAGYITYGQPILTGLLVQRNRIVSLLFFIPLSNWYRNKKITLSGILKTIGIFLSIYSSICIIQYLLSGVIMFMNIGGGERYGTTRFWFSGIYLVLFSGFAIDKLFGNKERKLSSILTIVISIIFFFIITKTRMAAISYVCAILICIILHKGNIRIKYLAIVMVSIGLLVLSNTNMGEDLKGMLMGQESISGDTTTVREVGRNYYISKTCENPIRFIIGCGSASANSNKALNMTFPKIFDKKYGYEVQLYPQDNGIFSMFYYYGFIGVFWWVIALLYSFINAKKINRKTGSYAFIFMLIFEIVSSFSLTPSAMGKSILFPLYWIMMIYKEKNMYEL